MGLTAISQPPKLNHVLTISWAARTTTLANNPRLEHIKSWIRSFPAHFMCWRSWTYVICVCTLSHGQIYFQQKNMCFAFWARVDTKFLNLSHPLLSMDGWPGDATFFLWGHVFSQKRSSPLEFIFDTCASASSSHFFWLVKLNICGCSLLLGQMYFQQKICVLQIWARVQDKCTPLQGQMYLWNLFLMSNLRTFSIIIIIAPFPQI